MHISAMPHPTWPRHLHLLHGHWLASDLANAFPGDAALVVRDTLTEGPVTPFAAYAGLPEWLRARDPCWGLPSEPQVLVCLLPLETVAETLVQGAHEVLVVWAPATLAEAMFACFAVEAALVCGHPPDHLWLATTPAENRSPAGVAYTSPAELSRSVLRPMTAEELDLLRRAWRDARRQPQPGLRRLDGADRRQVFDLS